MINKEKLREAIGKYKAIFDTRWDGERYKWEAVKWFEKYWDINAADFADMFGKATEKTVNLLASMNNFPRRMMMEYAEKDPEAVKAMYISLYDESKDVTERILKFQSDADELSARLSPGYQHYQRPMAITVYLWLRYPDKYDIFKYSVCKGTGAYLENDFKPKKGHTEENIKGNTALIDSILDVVNQDEELISMFEGKRTDACCDDVTHRMLAFDISVYIANYLNNPGKKEDAAWIGVDFNPGISVEKWLELFEDDSLFSVQSWEILYRFIDYGGMATCKQLSVKYGENNNFYSNGATALARKVADKVGCDVQVREKNGSKRYWSILFTGRKASDDEDGSFVWKLRDELAEALEQVDFSDTELYANADDNDFIMDMIREENQENPIATEWVDTYTQKDFLSEVYMTLEKYETLKGLLLNKKNIILQGAPGVGKTFAAKRLAYSIMGMKDDSRVEFIQFHQNYSYEDFIMGYKPSGDGFELQNGIFYKFCQKAANNPDKPHFFIIDEINRGNMSKIFGELLMLIEKDYRGTKLTLAYNGLAFSVPKNLYIIGMMNTADRSLALIDYALRRRFSFYAMEPGFATDGFREYMNSFDNDTFVTLIERVKDLNDEISKDPSLGRGFCIGHSYFCGQEECSDEWMQSVVEYDILPMLEEYWFDETTKLQKWQNILRGVFND